MSASVRVNPSDSWGTDVQVVRAAAGIVQLAGQDAFRLSVEVYADPNNTERVWIVPGTGSGSSKIGGRPLEAGASVTINTAAQVYAYVRTGAADQTVYVTVEGSVC